MSLGDPARLLLALDRPVAPRQDRHAGLLHRAACARLVAHQPNHVRIGADEADVAGLADFGQIGALGQEAVAGMDGVGAGDLGGADDGGHVQVAVGAARGTDADVLVGEPHVERMLVGFGVHGHGLDAEFAARVNHAQSDFSAVGNQNLLEHVATSP